MKKLKVVHLLDDLSLGGVTQALAIFEQAALAEVIESSVCQVNPEGCRVPEIDADIIITHFSPRWRALPFMAALRWRYRNARLMHIEHSYTAAWEARCVPHRWRFRRMLSLYYRFFERVVAVSKAQRQWLHQAVGVPARRLCVIPPWSPTEALEHLPLSDWRGQRPLVVGAYGRFSEQKGLEALIERFTALDSKRFELRVGGFGPLEDTLRKIAGEAPHIHFTGPVSSRAEFLEQCDVIAIPSRWEAWGLVATEARQAGRPILVSDVDGLPEQVGQAGYLVDFDSPTGLRYRLEEMTGIELICMGHAGRSSVTDLVKERTTAWRELLAPCPHQNAERLLQGTRPA
ncbi:glycosyltransferase family 4 protein [Kushneria phyllosphaerae]|uniref:N, N'-diacetylbacillosaminyl-diphospho-undecaprenol alpha-1,3-N-acetylgalactosaminyltransferase n=1 Tax=Kushneria phyllosphaerae TaxID=2100822 RepID=A0A2R8CI13_9GAMM|nr:glycosyltransferase family 4 protein [Kushneria phyllosphaerae]SPJ32452.1 N, N'-diacetylbacillosaminyl-diphospho-undecaprenol alpha-1,3-N-acetylgalactosaminyltransferase [Kushneria phyllosphaerae]